MIWNYIKADSFFRDYLPHVKNYKHKIRGKNGRGNPVEFPPADKAAIKAGLEQLFKDLSNDFKEL
ncbi:MAG: hypothetical protein EKK63_09045 [Acinetobacter sp.]|uniref:hypothetical protein n=1 Tax=Acinetobacter sp. TaxID=472 RepID=UPI000FA38038|nr:hypothetical protein [Acinetobacter sp.]RUP39774.1 MAG: hypothetical protein EKK63_09045 [Acinetobacter sp.]